VLQTDDRAAFRQLARREAPGLYALARRLAGEDAKDLGFPERCRAGLPVALGADHAAGAA
jgi:hypothetical protein